LDEREQVERFTSFQAENADASLATALNVLNAYQTFSSLFEKRQRQFALLHFLPDRHAEKPRLAMFESMEI